ncbi:Dioxygenase easH [Frankliniella fusca]|uniref:Dioxygenase easH n=1 Tax=Frankliniella fusca TaxID=407009 RepID=A0AAE1LUL0_9NEOP|nr:Dioxygenase easH [Frankliniella fusca]
MYFSPKHSDTKENISRQKVSSLLNKNSQKKLDHPVLFEQDGALTCTTSVDLPLSSGKEETLNLPSSNKSLEPLVCHIRNSKPVAKQEAPCLKKSKPRKRSHEFLETMVSSVCKAKGVTSLPKKPSQDQHEPVILSQEDAAMPSTSSVDLPLSSNKENLASPNSSGHNKKRFTPVARTRTPSSVERQHTNSLSQSVSSFTTPQSRRKLPSLFNKISQEKLQSSLNSSADASHGPTKLPNASLNLSCNDKDIEERAASKDSECHASAKEPSQDTLQSYVDSPSAVRHTACSVAISCDDTGTAELRPEEETDISVSTPEYLSREHIENQANLPAKKPQDRSLGSADPHIRSSKECTVASSTSLSDCNLRECGSRYGLRARRPKTNTPMVDSSDTEDEGWDSDSTDEWCLRELKSQSKVQSNKNHVLDGEGSDSDGDDSDDGDSYLTIPKRKSAKFTKQTRLLGNNSDEGNLANEELQIPDEESTDLDILVDSDSTLWIEGNLPEVHRNPAKIPPPHEELVEPIEYFEFFFDDEIIELMTNSTRPRRKIVTFPAARERS